MDVLAEKARTKPPWAMLFADDLVLVSETVEEVSLGALVRDLRRSCAYDRAFVNFGLLSNNYFTGKPFSVKLISN